MAYDTSVIPHFGRYLLSVDQSSYSLDTKSDSLEVVDLGYKPFQPVRLQLEVEDYCGLLGGESPYHEVIILSVESIEPYNNTLSWTPYVGWNEVDQYEIFRKAQGSSYEFLCAVAGNVLIFRDTNLCDETYTYRVKAVNQEAVFNSFSYGVSSRPIYIHNPTKSSLQNVTVKPKRGN